VTLEPHRPRRLRCSFVHCVLAEWLVPVLPEPRAPVLGAGAPTWVPIILRGESVLSLPRISGGESFPGRSRQRTCEECAEQDAQGGPTGSRGGQCARESIEAISIHMQRAHGVRRSVDSAHYQRAPPASLSPKIGRQPDTQACPVSGRLSLRQVSGNECRVSRWCASVTQQRPDLPHTSLGTGDLRALCGGGWGEGA